ncbi:MAG: hypothetical protein VX642_12245 [Bdellovibrionota bacterium]|nr:hypothetical protein [Bdellovibrionota bacterium]
MINKGRNILKDESGSIAVDFTFGLTLAIVSMGVFFAISLTLSMVELTQYVAFATSRTYHAGHLSQATQAARGDKKLRNLLSTEPFKTMLKESGWFEVKVEDSALGNYATEFNAADPRGRDIFEGAKLTFTADILDMSFPIIGGNSDGPFTTNVFSFLGREPSTQECMENFFKQKTNLIQGLGYTYPVNASAISVVPDNGC